MSMLSAAIRARRWELASLCLLVGVTEAAAVLPPEAVEGLIEVLADLEVVDGPSQRRKRRAGGAGAHRIRRSRQLRGDGTGDGRRR